MNANGSPTRIALCGMSGTGKSTAASYLKDKHGFQLLQSGKVCREFARKLFDNESKEILNQLTDAVRTIASSAWLNASLRSLSYNGPTVFDSARFSEDEEVLVRLEFTIIRIDCDLRLAVQRLASRGQQISVELDFAHESETSVFGMKPTTVIQNDSGVEDLYRQIDDVLIDLALKSGS